jgi:hypothetical protein
MTAYLDAHLVVERGAFRILLTVSVVILASLRDRWIRA